MPYRLRAFIFLCTLAASLPLTGVASESCADAFAELVAQYEAAVAQPRGSEDYVMALFAVENDTFDALERCPDDPHLWTLIGESEVALGRLQMAIVYARKVVALAPEYWRGYAVLGGALISNKDYAEGLMHLQRAAEMRPDNLTLKMNLCSAYAVAGENAKAASVCDEVIAKDTGRLRELAMAIKEGLK